MARNKSEKLTADQVKLVAFARLQERYERGLVGEGERYKKWIAVGAIYAKDRALNEDVRAAGHVTYETIAKCILKRYGDYAPKQ